MNEQKLMRTTDAERMTSLEIAQVTEKQHKNVMQAIRNMESAWEKTCGLKFQLTSRTIVQPNGGTREVPCYLLTKTECLYIATKFNDEARAKLVLRWEELEKQRLEQERKALRQTKPQMSMLLETEEVVLRRSDAIRRQLIGEENAPADDCLTMTEIAQALDSTVKELNKLLVAEGVQFWNGGRYKLTPKYSDRELAQDRAFHYYSLDGEKKERFYLVWTRKGRDFIEDLINIR